jgi:uncharacterized protein involved in exopolysaccharide biosynthesis
MDNKLPAERSEPTTYLQYPAPSPMDEISLVDLWLMLLRHKRLIATVFTAVVAIGIVLAFLAPRTYTYTTTIQIARNGNDLLEQPETLLAKLNESYIPFVLQQNFDAQPAETRPKIEANIPKDSRIIVMASEGAVSDHALHFKLHDQLMQRLAQDHDPEIDIIKLTMESNLNRIRNQLDKLKDDALSLQAQEKRLDEQESLLKDQLKDMRKLIDSSESNRSKAIKEVEGEAKAMTLLLIDTETKKYMDREAEIKERLLIGMSAERDNLKNTLADNLRRQTELQENLQEAQAKIVNIRYTRPIVPTLRSLEPHGTGKSAIVTLSGILGLMLGIFTAFLAEFRLKVRDKLNEQHS